MNKFLPTIGLEIHAELKTNSKMFCACRNNPDESKPNTNVCPICMGHPGTLPVPNMEAIKNVLKIGIACNATLADFTEWDRKNYFYPDIPKGYQISQFKYPLVSGGNLANVELERIHLEEDTASSIHDSHENSLVDFNRAGVPLMELVTKPVIHDAVTAVNFAKELQLLLRYLGAGDANLEKGEMRVEANISIAPILEGGESEGGTSALGTKTEVKNLNSFRAVERAITHEIERQTSLLNNGEKVIQETRGWDDNKNETYSQRKKEGSHDYRYFPEPDITKFKISEIKEFSIDVLSKSSPELPWVKRDRYRDDYAMTEKEVSVFIDSPTLSTYFEAVIETFKSDDKKIKLSINYILTDYLGALNKTSNANNVNKIKAKDFSQMIELIASGKISSRGAKDLITILLEIKETSGAEKVEIDISKLAEKHGLIQENNAESIVPTVLKVITDNANVVAEYKAGKTTSLQFLIGQVMKASKGRANPEMVKNMLIEKLKV